MPHQFQNTTRLLTFFQKIVVVQIVIFSLGFTFYSPVVLAAGYMDELAAEAEGSSTKSPSPEIDGSARKKSGNAYIDSLTGEADELSLDKASSVNDEDLRKIERVVDEGWSYDRQQLGVLKPDLSHPAFEKSLKHNYFVTYTLYNKLDNVSKDLVYQAYKDNPKIEYITQIISNLVR